MRVRAIIEWRGGTVGWWGAVRLADGREFIINSGHNPAVVRRRLRRAMIAAGVKNPTLDEDVRIPREMTDEVEGLKAFRTRADLATGEFVQERIRVAKRLLTELNLSESDVAGLLGIAQSHLANQLSKFTVETGEYEVESEISAKLKKAK